MNQQFRGSTTSRAIAISAALLIAIAAIWRYLQDPQEPANDRRDSLPRIEFRNASASSSPQDAGRSELALPQALLREQQIFRLIVTGTDGAPVKGALVLCCSRSAIATSPLERLELGTTDENGELLYAPAADPPHNPVVIALADSYIPGVGDYASEQLSRIRLARAESIHVTCLDESNHPVSNVALAASTFAHPIHLRDAAEQSDTKVLPGPDVSRSLHTAVTDSDGNARIDHVAPGSYRLAIHHPEFIVVSGPLTYDRIDVPGPRIVIRMTEPWVGVTRIIGDEPVAWQVRRTGMSRSVPGARADLARRERRLREKYADAIVAVDLPQDRKAEVTSNPKRVLIYSVLFARTGLRSVPIELAPSSRARVETLDLRNEPDWPGHATLHIRAPGLPDGCPPPDGLMLVPVAGPLEVPINAVVGEDFAVPAGRYQVRSRSDVVNAWLAEALIEVHAGVRAVHDLHIPPGFSPVRFRLLTPHGGTRVPISLTVRLQASAILNIPAWLDDPVGDLPGLGHTQWLPVGPVTIEAKAHGYKDSIQELTVLGFHGSQNECLLNMNYSD